VATLKRSHHCQPARGVPNERASSRARRSHVGTKPRYARALIVFETGMVMGIVWIQEGRPGYTHLQFAV
jgi:hypothetical protein